MPGMKTDTFELSLRTPLDYSLEQTKEISGALEQSLRSQKTVKTVFSQVGIVSGLEGINPDISVNSARILIAVDKHSSLEGVLETLRQRLAGYPDLSYTLVREQSTLAEFLAFTPATVGLKLKGDDLEELEALSDELAERLKTVKGITDVNTSYGEGKAEFRVSVREEAMKKYSGLSPGAIADFLVGAVRGRIATQLTNLERKYDILVRLEDASGESLESLLNKTFPHQGKLIPLRELVACQIVRGPREIRRENQQREVLIEGNLNGVKISQVAPAVNRIIAGLSLPPDCRVVFSGEQEEMASSFRSLALALILATLLTYMIMAAQFESLLHPFLVLFTLPMGVSGSIIALFLTGQTINVISAIGLIVLVGIVVDNAIVKIDYTNQLRKAGLALREAVLEGSIVRLRPILMSTLSTLFGLIPMALGLERGAELMQPLAIVVIGGLTFSTFLTLILIPVVYELAEKRKR
jgi:HAE1 family hydrophobic/amphiphilic exporter-1